MFRSETEIKRKVSGDNLIEDAFEMHKSLLASRINTSVRNAVFC